jgi:hypothetical protein
METMQLVFDDTNFNEDCYTEFPSSITLDQAVATWKCIVDYSNEKNT